MSASKDREFVARKLTQDVRALLDGKGGTIDQGVFLQEVMDAFGGPRALALAMVEEYHEAAAGGLARQKLLQTIQHLIISTTQFNMTKVRDANKMTDEELQQGIAEYLGQVEAGELVAPEGVTEATE